MNKFNISNLKNYLCLSLLYFAIQPCFSQCPTIVWQDEFSGNTLDLNNWNYQIGDGCAEGICGWGNNELQSYQQDNVTVSNGTLKITARKERIRGKKYTSGRINSKGKGDFTYGRFEASIKLPFGDGLWPAFWMLSTDEPYGGWPQSGEIDIMEFVASNPDKILGYIHYGDLYPNNQSQGNTYQLNGALYPDDFHEFAVEWEPGEIRWFVDGILFSVKRTEDLSPFNWPFDHDFHFLLNVAVGGNLGGPVNDNMLPATMEVDYVRVYDGYKSYISGDKVVANQAQGVNYTIGNVANNVNVTWSVPQGATIVSGQGTNSIVVDFGNESGAVSASFNDGCTNQNLSMSVEVEPPYVKAFSFENFDEAPTATFSSSTGVLTEVANPAPNAVNSSALSGKYDRNGSEQYDVVVYDVNNITDASQYVNKNKKFYLDVHTSAPVGTEIILQLENSNASATNYPTGRHSRYIATITDTNNWQRLAFAPLDQPDPGASDASVSSLILLFASNSFTSDTYYYDNFDSYDADMGTGSNQPPSVTITSPVDDASFTEGTTITITADASDTDGTIGHVEFFIDGSSIGSDATEPYSIDWQVALGSSTITASATDNENASTGSAPVSVTGQSAGNPTSIHVASIVTGTAGAGRGQKYGTATVTIVDDLGNLVENATVTGTFSGTFSEQASGITDANGVAVLQTQASAKGAVTVDLCVDNVSYSLPYDPNSNTVTCSNSSNKIASSNSNFPLSNVSSTKKFDFTIYPNPAKDVLNFSLNGDITSTQILIFDVRGTLLYSSAAAGNNGHIDISTLAKGIYIIRVQDQFNQVKTRRLTKY